MSLSKGKHRYSTPHSDVLQIIIEAQLIFITISVLVLSAAVFVDSLRPTLSLVPKEEQS